MGGIAINMKINWYNQWL